MSEEEAVAKAEEYLREIVEGLLAEERYVSGEYDIGNLVSEYVRYEMWDSDIEKFLEIASAARLTVFGFVMNAPTIYTLEDIQRRFIVDILTVACVRRVDYLRNPD